MRDVLTKLSKENLIGHVSRSAETRLLEGSDFRAVVRRSVLYLSTLLAFGGLLNLINREEGHISMWISLGIASAVLAITWRVPPSSQYLIVRLHGLMAVMVINICVQVVHGASSLLLWTLPFYLIWITLLPTSLVAIIAAVVSAVTTWLAENHPIVPANYMLGLSVVLVVHLGKEHIKELVQLASSDALTGAFNRRYLVAQLSSMRAEFTRNGRISSLMLIDLDGLKMINDHFGHNKGDAVLKTLVNIIRQRVRGTDTLFRIGGDEFALILVDAKASAALTVANQLRELIREQTTKEVPSFSISCGVCSVDDSTSPEEWLERADEALYEAKRQGGDVARMAS